MGSVQSPRGGKVNAKTMLRGLIKDFARLLPEVLVWLKCELCQDKLNSSAFFLNVERRSTRQPVLLVKKHWWPGHGTGPGLGQQEKGLSILFIQARAMKHQQKGPVLK